MAVTVQKKERKRKGQKQALSNPTQLLDYVEQTGQSLKE
jgi:hypothetical protein